MPSAALVPRGPRHNLDVLKFPFSQKLFCMVAHDQSISSWLALFDGHTRRTTQLEDYTRPKCSDASIYRALGYINSRWKSVLSYNAQYTGRRKAPALGISGQAAQQR